MKNIEGRGPFDLWSGKQGGSRSEKFESHWSKFLKQNFCNPQYDDTEVEIMRYSLERRLGAVKPVAPAKETKLYRYDIYQRELFFL